MNHSDAIRTKAAAGYLLGDLSDAERDAFESHYFDCSVCSADVRAGAVMFAAGKELVKSEPSRFRRAPMKIKWLITSAAAVVLAFVLGTQRPAQRADDPIEALTPGGLITGTMRASENAPYEIAFEGNRPRLEHVDITDTAYPEYSIEIRDASRELVASTSVSAQEARNESGVPFLLRPLPAGSYVLTINGVRKDGNRREIEKRIVVVQ